MSRLIVFLGFVLATAVQANSGAYIQHVQKAYQYSLSGMKEKAIVEFEAALALEPNDADLHMKVADLKGCPNGKDNLKQAIEVDPNNWRALAKLGECLLEQGDMEEGRTLVERALELNATDVDLRVMAGHWSMEMQEFENAAAHYDAVLEADADNFEAMERLGAALVKLGRYEDAEEKLKQAAKFEPKNPKPYLYMAEAQRGTERGATACISLEMGASLALEAKPFDPDLSRQFVESLAVHCPKSKALPALKSAF